MSTLEIPTARVFLPLLTPSRFKAAYGGRGSGKSHLFADLAVERCIAKPGTSVVCIREFQRSLRESSKKLIETKIYQHELAQEFEIQEQRIRTPGGGVIIFEGMQNHNAHSIKGFEGFDIAWCDEAAALSQRSINMLLPTLRKKDSELWFSWNPESPKDPVDAMFRGGEPPPNSIVVEANYQDNPWFEDDTELVPLKDWDQRRDPDRYAHIWLGKYLEHSEARVFRNWRIEEFPEPSSDTRFYMGADWGFAVDPSVLVRCFTRSRTLYVDHEAWAIGCEIDRTPALFDKVPGARRWPIRADSSNPQAISYMRRHGFENIHPAVKGPGSIEEGIEFLKSYDIVVHPRCKHVADELSMYSYEIDKQTGEVLPKLADKKNHTIDALRYALETVRRAPPVAITGTFRTA